MRPGAPLKVFHVAGDDVEMGHKLGQAMREAGDYDEILRYFQRLPNHILGLGRRDQGRRMLIRTLEHLLQAGLARLDRARPFELRARTVAFMKALGRPAEERLGLVALDGTQNTIGLLARAGLSGTPQAESLSNLEGLAFPGACSSFAVWGGRSEDGRLLHARNFDLPDPGAWARSPAIVFCSPRRGLRYGYATTVGADIPGVTAFNEAGITVTAHTRFHQQISFDGLSIVDLGHLIVRSARTLTEAVAIASSRRVGSSWALVVSSAKERRAVAIEVHAGRVAVDCGDSEREFFCTTNRNQVPAMQTGEVAPSAAWVRYCDGRKEAMTRALDAIEPGHGFRVEDAKALLASHLAGDTLQARATGDCLGQSITLQSVVVDPERQVIHVSTGDHPASRGPWIEVDWRWEDSTSMIELRPADPDRQIMATPPDRFTSGAEGRAYERFLTASRLEIKRAPSTLVRDTMEQAVGLCPGDPSFRHLAGGLALRDGDLPTAAEHLTAGLQYETSPFRQVELLRWSAKIARWSGQHTREHTLRGALMDRLPRHLVAGVLRDIERRRRPEAVGVDFQLLTITT